MQCNEPFRVRKTRHDLFGVEIGGIGRKQGCFAADQGEISKDLPLDGKVFEDRLDHEVAAGHLCQPDRATEPGAAGGGFGLVMEAAFHLGGEDRVDSRQTGVKRRAAGLGKGHPQPGIQQCCGDTAAHGAAADDADRVKGSGGDPAQGARARRGAFGEKEPAQRGSFLRLAQAQEGLALKTHSGRETGGDALADNGQGGEGAGLPRAALVMDLAALSQNSVSGSGSGSIAAGAGSGPVRERAKSSASAIGTGAARPMRRASGAVISRPPVTTPMAASMPMRRGSLWVPPAPGMMPSRVSGRARRAVSAKRR